jgi:hypothetical protein
VKKNGGQKSRVRVPLKINQIDCKLGSAFGNALSTFFFLYNSIFIHSQPLFLSFGSLQKKNHQPHLMVLVKAAQACLASDVDAYEILFIIGF